MIVETLALAALGTSLSVEGDVEPVLGVPRAKKAAAMMAMGQWRQLIEGGYAEQIAPYLAKKLVVLFKNAEPWTVDDGATLYASTNSDQTQVFSRLSAAPYSLTLRFGNRRTTLLAVMVSSQVFAPFGELIEVDPDAPDFVLRVLEALELLHVEHNRRVAVLSLRERIVRIALVTSLPGEYSPDLTLNQALHEHTRLDDAGYPK